MRPSSGPLNQSPASPQPLSPLQLRAGPASSPDLARRGRRAYPSGGRRPAGFTLVEMLVVISIIAILAGMLMPAIMAARVKAQETHTLNLIHNCEIAATDFFNDYGDYPPSTWAELDEFFEVEHAPSGGLFSDIAAHKDSYDTWVDEFPGEYEGANNTELPHETPRVCRTNEGIEVFLACVASQNGGPYMEVEASWVANTDADFDRDCEDDRNSEDPNDLNLTPDILQTTNWYFGGTVADPQPARELVDYWGNPLVYIHNRDYDRYDRHSPNYAFTTYPDDHWPRYARSGYASWGDPDSDGTDEVLDNLDDTQLRYPLAVSESELGAPPNLSSFQLYSWGVDGEPGDYHESASAEKQQQWRDNLANWELEE